MRNARLLTDIFKVASLHNLKKNSKTSNTSQDIEKAKIKACKSK